MRPPTTPHDPLFGAGAGPGPGEPERRAPSPGPVTPMLRPPVRWPLSAFLEMDRNGRVLRFQGHDPESHRQADLLLGHDLFEVLGRTFDTRHVAERYRLETRRTAATRFADSYPILIDGTLYGVRVVFSFVPRLGRGCASIRTSGDGELLRAVCGA